MSRRARAVTDVAVPVPRVSGGGRPVSASQARLRRSVGQKSLVAHQGDRINGPSRDRSWRRRQGSPVDVLSHITGNRALTRSGVAEGTPFPRPGLAGAQERTVDLVSTEGRGPVDEAGPEALDQRGRTVVATGVGVGAGAVVASRVVTGVVVDGLLGTVVMSESRPLWE